MEKAYNGRTQSAEWLEKAIKLKTVILAKIDSMPEALRTVAPSPNDWSASGMVEHLVSRNPVEDQSDSSLQINSVGNAH